MKINNKMYIDKKIKNKNHWLQKNQKTSKLPSKKKIGLRDFINHVDTKFF